MKMAEKNINTTVKLVVPEFATDSVVVKDNAVVITFTSDGVKKTKTLPFTKDGLKIMNKVKGLLEREDYNINDVWKDIKEGGRLHGIVYDLAEIARKKAKEFDDEFAKLKAEAGIEVSLDPIDAL